MEREKDGRHCLRWLYLAVGTLALLLAGIIYGWSILKAPLAAEFGWTADQLALNYTLTLCCFCLGGFAGGISGRRLGARLSLILAGVASFSGFWMASRMTGSSVSALYLSYGILAGLGIGVAYNVIISTISAWFPDRKGFCSGTLMMGFGASALVVGKLANVWINTPSVGWRRTFAFLGIGLGAVLIVLGFVLHLPPADVKLPQPERKTVRVREDFGTRDYAPKEMVRRVSFWKAFFCLFFLSSVGNTVISFAKDLSLSVGAGEGLATTLVGMLSVCNGIGRVIVGILFDKAGRKRAMVVGNLAAIAATAILLAAVQLHAVPLCVVGMCITGFSYGACATITSTLTAVFYGQAYFSVNFSVMNFDVLLVAFMPTVASIMLTATGGYAAPFLMLLVFAVASLGLDLSIKRP